MLNESIESIYYTYKGSVYFHKEERFGVKSNMSLDSYTPAPFGQRYGSKVNTIIYKIFRICQG